MKLNIIVLIIPVILILRSIIAVIIRFDFEISFERSVLRHFARILSRDEGKDMKLC